MRAATVLVALAALAGLACSRPTSVKIASSGKKIYGAYVLLTRGRNGEPVGMSQLDQLTSQASSLPLNRIWIAFFSPTMVYVPGSATLVNTGLNLTSDADLGFARLKQDIKTLVDSGVEVFLSMGGWDKNCFPYAYMYYSVGGYGPNTPNYWKIQQYGGGDKNNCVESNQFCWVCEPISENTTLDAFGIFPEVEHSSTWQEAVQYVAQGAKGSVPPKYNYDVRPNASWTDPNTTRTVTVPGSDLYYRLNRDPYQDIVYLANDLGATGIDLDYEEFWHGDTFKVIDDPEGPYELPQTVYKYSTIAKDLMINIQKYGPKLQLSTAAGAVGAWQGNWWGGNLKGLWYWTKQWYPEVIDFMTNGPNAGGISVMTYDLSKNEQYHECPSDDICTLSEQVAFYMQTYQNASIPASVGYEIGIPAYPAPDHDKADQLPLTTSELETITTQTQPQYDGGFFWAIYKPTGSDDNASPTAVAQALCKILSPDSTRCSGTLPDLPPM